jgi:hypothetical protein
MQSEISQCHAASSTHFALFIIFFEHQFKKVLKQEKNYSFFTMSMHCTSNLLGKKILKMTQQLKREKYEYPS